MFLSISLLSILAANFVFAGHPIIEASEKKCIDCQMLLNGTKSAIEEATELTEKFVEEAVKNECDRLKSVFAEICECLEKKVFEELFKWIISEEQKMDVKRGCEHIRFCPHTK
ncbi:hypothetical protein DICVIV_11645 [Dictyocaulus viviparus]|uniref:Saposin B-type domain-containing protein n=1 Tax=Dictyocaulus viviparus TaxID=29172 RepID=A0A0D8XCN4_DICVI|nr:hypothetical protein DICVIV_11645 [Dictyocaulus viviparus]